MLSRGLMHIMRNKYQLERAEKHSYGVQRLPIIVKQSNSETAVGLDCSTLRPPSRRHNNYKSVFAEHFPHSALLNRTVFNG
jgi:hypothetical protein